MIQFNSNNVCLYFANLEQYLVKYSIIFLMLSFTKKGKYIFILFLYASYLDCFLCFYCIIFVWYVYVCLDFLIIPLRQNIR